MFTGLVQTLGTVKKIDRQGHSAQLFIRSELVNQDIELGESIAVNGVCLTVVSWDSDSFAVDVSPETLDCSTLGSLGPGAEVNLERALRLCDRLGGHLVSGHIDGKAMVRKRYEDANVVRFEFAVDEGAMRYIVAKGSIAIDGISLTVNSVSSDSFSVAVIPHSLAMTTLQHRREGSQVNIETDILGRYVERLLGQEGNSESQGVSLDFLAKNGFL